MFWLLLVLIAENKLLLVGYRHSSVNDSELMRMNPWNPMALSTISALRKCDMLRSASLSHIIISGEQPSPAPQLPATLSASATLLDDDSYCSSSCSSYKPIVTVVRIYSAATSNKNSDAYKIKWRSVWAWRRRGEPVPVVKHCCTTAVGTTCCMV